MSSSYEANVNVVMPQRGRQWAIAQALEAAGFREEGFDLDGLDDSDELIELTAQVALSGVGDEEYARSLAECIWEANQEFCEVEITMTYLEDRPFEQYEFDHVEYDDWLTTSSKGSRPA